MSSEAIGWVFRYSPYRGAALAVHLAIADSVNDQSGYEFWMRQAVCAAKARCSRQAVNEAIARMVEEGLLVLLRHGTGGANRYRMVMPGDMTPAYEVSSVATPPSPPASVNRDDTRVSTETTGGVNREDTEPKRTQGKTQPKTTPPPPPASGGSDDLVEDPLEDSNADSSRSKPRTVDSTRTSTDSTRKKRRRTSKASDEEFDRFWRAYPRHVAKDAARKAFDKAVARVSVDEIVAGAARYNADPNRSPGYTKHPTTWLNGGCWDDEPELPRSGDGVKPANHESGIFGDESRVLTDEELEAMGW